MAEEVKNASTDVARSMVYSLLINGCLAFGMLIAVLFSTKDIASIEGNLMVGIFRSTVQSNAGATVMTSIVIILEFCSAMGCLAAASRMAWSFGRDRGLPFSRYISMVISKISAVRHNY